VSWIPFAKVEVALVPVTLRYDDWRPLVKVEVAEAVTAREPVTARLDVVAFVLMRFVAKRLVEVAFVVVPLFTVKRSMVEEALMAIPSVVVGVSAPPTMFQLVKADER
jgi:hypothetical protein